MATNSNNLEPEFDALLKAHVKQSGNVAVCHQFDPDDATAYLERALSQTALVQFEAHLSTCSGCRRHLIELSRLMPPQTVTTPVVGVQESLKSWWLEWFSGWRLGALAGVGAVAATILVVTTLLTTNSTENVSQVATSKQSSTEASPMPSAALGNDLERLSEPKGLQKNVSVPSASVAVPNTKGDTPDSLSGNESNTLGAEVPPPPPPAPVSAPAITSPNTVLKDTPVPMPAAGVVATQNQTNNFRAQTPSGPENNQLQAERALEARKREASSQQPVDTPAPTPARPAAKPTEQAEEKIVERSSKERADDTDKKQAKPKPSLRTAPSASLSRTLPPGRVVSGKTFYHENGLWVDADYTANQNLPVIRLARDSDAFKQVLKDTPALKPYFDLKSVLVVWQGKVYRVENK